MKVFFINLAHREDRLKFILTQLKKVEPVLGKKIFQSSKLFNHRRYKLENRQNLVPGEVGCAQSHINIWQKIVDHDLEYALVLEDDVYITNEIQDLLSDYQLISQFDYLKVDDCHFHDYRNINSDDLLKHGIENYEGKIYREIKGATFSAFECDPVPYGAGGYIISKHAAKNFLEISKKMYYPIDLLPRYSAGQLRQGFTSHAFVLMMDVTDSNIGERKKGIKLTLAERFIWVLHKLFNRRRLRQLDLIVMHSKLRSFFKTEGSK